MLEQKIQIFFIELDHFFRLFFLLVIVVVSVVTSVVVVGMVVGLVVPPMIKINMRAF